MKKYIKKEQTEKLQSPFTPVKKANDVTRRHFLRKATLMMAGLGIPQFVRLEKVSKLSKEVFGSPTAFAQTGGIPLYTIFLLCRSGIPPQCMLAQPNDVSATRHVDRNIHCGANTIYQDATNNLLFTPQAAEVDGTSGLPTNPLAANFADRIAFSQAWAQNGGHTSLFQSAIGSDTRTAYHGPVAAKIAADNGAAYPIAGGVKIGTGNTDINLGKGADLAAYLPFELTNEDSVQNTFLPIEPEANGYIFPEDLIGKVLDATGKLSDAHFQKVSAKSGTEKAAAMSQSAYSLLQSDWATPLLQRDGADFGANENANRANNPMGLGNAMRVAINGFAEGAFGVAYAQVNSGDWHGSNEKAANADDPGNNNDMAGLGSTLSRVIGQSLLQAQGILDQQGNPVADNLCIVVLSEFFRTPLMTGGTNNNDQGCDGSIIISPTVNPGVYGDIDDNGQVIPFATDGNGPSLNPGGERPSHQQHWSTIAAAIGLDATQYKPYVGWNPDLVSQFGAVSSMIKS